MKGKTVDVKGSEDAVQCPAGFRYSCSCTPGIYEGQLVCGMGQRSEDPCSLENWGTGTGCSGCPYRVDIPAKEGVRDIREIAGRKQEYFYRLVERASESPRFVR